MRRFSDRVMTWQAAHGRHSLPWQQPRTPYRVWVSEVMLQQTQVAVVVGYFTRWMQRFPDIRALASAPQSDVMTHWAGLGYYARGRNLHAAAQILVAEHNGRLPDTVEALVALPGIGRSTAGAIVSLGHGQHAAILDGNVKRVLARHALIDGWPGRSAVQRQLWALAEQRTPGEQAAVYNQGMMDLGALVCTRAQPRCADCPVADDCGARQLGRQGQLPAPKPKRAKPSETLIVLLATRQGRVLLPRRPARGIWGGLRAPPMASGADRDVNELLADHQLRAVGPVRALDAVRHGIACLRAREGFRCPGCFCMSYRCPFRCALSC